MLLVKQRAAQVAEHEEKRTMKNREGQDLVYRKLHHNSWARAKKVVSPWALVSAWQELNATDMARIDLFTCNFCHQVFHAINSDDLTRNITNLNKHLGMHHGLFRGSKQKHEDEGVEAMQSSQEKS